LKVSRTENVTDLTTNNWYTNVVNMGGGIDNDTLGLDDNGIYLTGVSAWSNTNSDHRVVAVKKPEI